MRNDSLNSRHTISDSTRDEDNNNNRDESVFNSRMAPPFVPYEMSLKSMNNKEFKTFIKTNQKSFLICVTVTNNLSKNAFQNLREIETPLVHGKTVP